MMNRMLSVIAAVVTRCGAAAAAQQKPGRASKLGALPTAIPI